jgi:hypothetical protein
MTDVTIAEVQAEKVRVRDYVELSLVATRTQWLRLVGQVCQILMALDMLPVADRADGNLKCSRDIGVRHATAE